MAAPILPAPQRGSFDCYAGNVNPGIVVVFVRRQFVAGIPGAATKIQEAAAVAISFDIGVNRITGGVLTTIPFSARVFAVPKHSFQAEATPPLHPSPQGILQPSDRGSNNSHDRAVLELHKPSGRHAAASLTQL